MTHRLAIAVCLLVVAVVALPARAHDTGLSHASRTMGITATPTGFIIEYRIHVTPEVAILEMIAMDTDHDGTVTDAERDTWCRRRGAAILAGLNLTWAADKHVPARLTGWSFGSALTQTYRIELPLVADGFQIDDRNFQSQPGHLRIRTGPGIHIDIPPPDELLHVDRIRLTITRTPAP